ncbi:charged multivesicular body protein 4b-like isoform X2 [Zophobas morio]|uniref:charged multivesicular body protein 4b-like isoform X2 n=1 Tax=Zophobas morio TaxID=2755281 RepID=UPI003083AD77
MSFLQKVMGRKPKKAPALPDAIQRLKGTEEILLKRQSYLEEKIKREVATAKKNASTNKKVALQALQRKKRYEKQLQQVDGALTTLETQRDVLENANTNTLALDSMQRASKALKAVHKDIDVDKVDQILEDLAEQREVSDEIADAIGQPVGFNDGDLDEDELERELEELTEGLEEFSVEEDLPSVPVNDVRIGEKRKEKEKRKVLAAS